MVAIVLHIVSAANVPGKNCFVFYPIPLVQAGFPTGKATIEVNPFFEPKAGVAVIALCGQVGSGSYPDGLSLLGRLERVRQRLKSRGPTLSVTGPLDVSIDKYDPCRCICQRHFNLLDHVKSPQKGHEGNECTQEYFYTLIFHTLATPVFRTSVLISVSLLSIMECGQTLH
jgi:hypothetical protein